MIRADVRPTLLRWARERAGMTIDDLTGRFPKLHDWEQGTERPTLKQLEGLAKATYAPIGYFFLQAPPEEKLPLPDFRRVAGHAAAQPSPNLLETIYICQQRQSWYRDYAKTTGEDPLPFVGSVGRSDSIEKVAGQMRQALGFDLDARRNCPTWTDALRTFIAQADAAGILVMCSGVVLNNNRRRLDPEEFRGFAIADDLAPLVFINGADTKAAQMFTLAHELAHLWLGQSAVSDADAFVVPEQQVESWCNQVAAEMLVPMKVLREELRPHERMADAAGRLARRFKVSSLVMLRRLHDAGATSQPEFKRAYAAELERLRDVPKGSGGDFYLTQAARVSKRFARALVTSTLEGQTLYRDAFQMLGITKAETFHELGRNLEARI
jgi:Zn-dependent peptidase ImmA (M78 family)/transcriptional regulator with XRE-family HTH domain